MKKAKGLPRQEVFVRSGNGVVIGTDEVASPAVDAGETPNEDGAAEMTPAEESPASVADSADEPGRKGRR